MELFLVLHPGLKTQYFRDQDWPEEWIDEALRLARETWHSHYKPAIPPAPREPRQHPVPKRKNGPGTGRMSAQASTNAVSAFSDARHYVH